MLVGRWGSATVLRYVAEAPLQCLTLHYKIAARRCKGLRQELRRGKPKARARWGSRLLGEKTLTHLRTEVERLAREERALQARVSAVEQGASVPALVENLGSGVLHRVEVAGPAPPPAWRTLCGWRFASSPHSFREPADADAPAAKRCDRCWPPAVKRRRL